MKKIYFFQVIYSYLNNEFEHGLVDFENIKQVKGFIKLTTKKIRIKCINLFINSKTKHSEKQIIHTFFADTPFVQAIEKNISEV